MRGAIGFSVFGSVAMLVGLVWPSGAGGGGFNTLFGSLVPLGFLLTCLGVVIAAAVRGAGRSTVGLVAAVGVAVAIAVAGGVSDLMAAVGGPFVVPLLIAVPAILSGLTIRVPLAGDKIKLYPATAARVEITRDHEGEFAVRHPDGRVLARGVDAVQLLQGLAGPLADHGLLWGGDVSADAPPLSAASLGEQLEQLLHTRTTVPLIAGALPMPVWEALLGLEPEYHPVVAGRLRQDP
jgi:hypothetical protein